MTFPAPSSPPALPSDSLGQLENDAFCEPCGYNLHGQLITREPNTQLIVVRCPECGRFHAVNHLTTATHTWLKRFAAALMVFWWLAAMGAQLFFLLMMWLLPMGYLETNTWTDWVDPNPFQNGRYERIRRLNDLAHAGPERVSQLLLGSILWVAFAGLSAFLCGAFAAVAFWHTRGWRRWILAALPVLAFVFGTVLWIYMPENRSLRLWGASRYAAFWIWQTLCLLAGLTLGRPVARFLLSIFLPPRARQFFACLWLRDGKLQATH